MYARNMNKRTASCSPCFLVALVVLSSVCEGSRSNLMDAATMRSGDDVRSESVLLKKSSRETAGESASPKGEYWTSGSSLPDCSHACGPCFPCKRVMVSFECTIAESCPIVYRCMCKGRYYHVPSN